MSESSDAHERRIAVISGASRGIGFATARALLAAGYRTAIFSQNASAIASAGDNLSADFGAENVFARSVDLRCSEAIAGYFTDLQQQWGAPAILVCNAGISLKAPDGTRVPFCEVTEAEWEDALRVNLTATLLCCQAVLPAMADNGLGRIILIGSIATRALPYIAGTSYLASKSGLAGLMRAIISEYSSRHVTANIVAPGLILTEMAGSPDELKNQLALKRIPAGVFGTPDDVARVVTFLASKDAYFINGATIDVNGGEYIAA